jgi:N,N'-diacetyllegionaminate synthase
MHVRTLIIAEAGVNHNGDLGLAKQLVHVAADAGVDCVKFQTFNATRLATTVARKAEYQMKATGRQESQQEMLRGLELTEDMHRVLIGECALRKVGFLSTAFDVESIDFLLNLGQDRFKIPSGEITNLPYLRHIGRLQRELILSTGMATMHEIEAALLALEKSGTRRSNVTVLHCTTAYPTPMVEVNLRAMQSIRSHFGVKVGYSDHTLGIEVPIAAVAMGASIIEKHLTLDRSLVGPDHKASLEPDELTAMVRAIRNIEMAMGDGVKCPTASETQNKSISRKSLVARKYIKKGDVFSSENITSKRPGTGVSPMQWDEVVGGIAKRDFSKDDLIEL